ncbi:MAG: peptide chain release factor N(5)-glutamine methyltransferase [Lentisphaeria bacterium]|nr:peptide chain release factor N(5)-glutamine methyltransferase [Lentisphaeria bacterium]
MTPAGLKKLFELQFAAAGIETPAVDAALLISEAAGISRLDMILYPERELCPETETFLRKLAQRRCQREPLQYITGKAYFRDLILSVNPAVLIPRPETELLVDFALKKTPRNGRLLDIGTGSGAIAIACATERPDLAVTAVDISPAALEKAKENSKANGAENIRFLESDLFSAVEGEKFDFIAANLPYVTEEEYSELAPEVREHEPVLALTAPDEGFLLIQKTVEALRRHLKPGGKAAFELSPFQASRLKNLLETLGFSAQISLDLTGRERFVFAEM